MVDDDALVDLAGHEALEVSDEVALGEALSSPSSNIVDGRLVEAHAHDHGAVERCVRLAVAGSRREMGVTSDRFNIVDRVEAASQAEHDAAGRCFARA